MQCSRINASHYALQEIYVIKQNDFTKSNEENAILGRGLSGNTVKGEYKGTSVAIKTFFIKSCPPHGQIEFDVYCKAQHPNILEFHGVCLDAGNFAMISEIAYINFNIFIKKDLPPNTLTTHGCAPPPLVPLIAQGILKGVAHLHSMGFGHTNLKDTNVFLMENFAVKLGDFGLCGLKLEDSESAAYRGEGTIRWHAPEVLTRAYARSQIDPSSQGALEVQKPADMHSVGLLIWQMLSRKVPFERYTETQVVNRCHLKEQEEIDPKWPPFYRTLLSDCWNLTPNSRPTAIQVLHLFENRDASKVFLLFASICGDENVFSQHGMRDILKSTLLPLMFATEDSEVSLIERKELIDTDVIFDQEESELQDAAPEPQAEGVKRKADVIEDASLEERPTKIAKLNPPNSDNP